MVKRRETLSIEDVHLDLELFQVLGFNGRSTNVTAQGFLAPRTQGRSDRSEIKSAISPGRRRARVAKHLGGSMFLTF